MSVVINTNTDSLRIQNVLTGATNKLSNSMQRMSTGLKINQAKDDAAGTVISSRMAVQLDGNSICQNNVQNANALLSTAEGNIDVVLDNISRIRDLTLQAKNGTYSTEEKQAMQDEVAQRIAEIDRISTSSKFSQLQLFGEEKNGAAAGLNANGATFQVGANSADDNTISIASSDGVFSSVKLLDVLKHTEKTEATDAVTAVDVNPTAIKGIKTTDELGELAAGAANDVYFNKETGKFYKAKSTTAGDFEEIKRVNPDQIKGVYDSDLSDVTGTAKDIVYRSDNDTYWINTDGAKTWVQIAADKGIGATIAAGAEVEKEVSYATNASFDLTKMTNTGENTFTKALSCLDAAIDNLTSRKSTIGSYGNRLDTALNTLTTQYTNLSSAKSIITDADIASEASTYTQNQILQQVSTSLLTQANQSPSLALSLV